MRGAFSPLRFTRLPPCRQICRQVARPFWTLEIGGLLINAPKGDWYGESFIVVDNCIVSISLGLCDTMQLPFFSSDPVGSISDCRGEFSFRS